MLKPLLLATLVASTLFGSPAVWATDRAVLSTVAVQSSQTFAGDRTSYDGVVEAVRQSTLSAQVPGSIVALNVKAGDLVRAGQELVRIDARAANQNAVASVAQVEAARANLNVTSKGMSGKTTFSKAVHQPGSIGPCTGTVSSRTGPIASPASAIPLGANPVKVLYHHGSLRGCSERSAGDDRRHGNAWAPAGGPIRSRRSARDCCGCPRHHCNRSGSHFHPV